LNPNGIPAQSPGLRGRSYPGKSRQKANNPNGVAARWRKFDTTPLGLKIPSAPTQGSSFLATLGPRAQSLWDCRTAIASLSPLLVTSRGLPAEVPTIYTASKAAPREGTRPTRGCRPGPLTRRRGFTYSFTYFVTSQRLRCRNR